MQLSTYPPDISGNSRREPRKYLRGADLITRAATAELLRQQVGAGHENVEKVVARIYGRCPATLAYIERAAVNPANSTVAGWASELVGQSIGNFLADMKRTSAFAALAQQAMNLTLPDGTGSIKIPGRAQPLVLVGAWIAEAGPKPVAAITLGTTTLTPCKLSAISVFSEELLEHSIPSIEAVVTEALRHDLGALLDTALLDSAAASAVRSAGLFNGATSVTASTATPLIDACFNDLGALTAAVSGTGNPDARVVFVVNPKQNVRLGALGFTNVIVSGFMPAGSVGAIDAGAIAMMAGEPAFAVSRSAVLNMESAPTAIGTPPNVMAAPTSSMFQTDNVAIRSSLKAGWVKRRTGATAMVASCTW